MDNITKNDAYYISKIIINMEFLIAHTKSKTLEQISKNELLIDSIMFRLIQISENANKLSEAIKKDNPKISWNAIKGMRNRIVHDYGNVDYYIIFNTITNVIPECLKQLKTIKFKNELDH